MVIMNNTLIALQLNIYKIKTSVGTFVFDLLIFMLKGNSLLHFINLLSPNKYENNNHKILLKYF